MGQFIYLFIYFWHNIGINYLKFIFLRIAYYQFYDQLNNVHGYQLTQLIFLGMTHLVCIRIGYKFPPWEPPSVLASY